MTEGFLQRIMKSQESGICRNCGNLLQVSKTALGCAAHDKLILPDYPPYHGSAKCKDWSPEGANSADLAEGHQSTE